MPEEPNQSGREQNALLELSDEIMSALHAEQLRHDSVPSSTVTQWLRQLYDIAQGGLGRPRGLGRESQGDAEATG